MTLAPQSPPCAPKRSWPSTSDISRTQRAAVDRTVTPVRSSGVEKAYPGSDGTTTSNASAGSAPHEAGSANASMVSAKSQKVHGQPWVSTSGKGSGPAPGRCR